MRFTMLVGVLPTFRSFLTAAQWAALASWLACASLVAVLAFGPSVIRRRALRKASRALLDHVERITREAGK